MNATDYLSESRPEIKIKLEEYRLRGEVCKIMENYSKAINRKRLEKGPVKVEIKSWLEDFISKFKNANIVPGLMDIEDYKKLLDELNEIIKALEQK